MAAEAHSSLLKVSQIAPTIFDLLAQQALHDLLLPAAHNLLEALLVHSSYSFLLKWSDEFLLAANSLLQSYYLSTTGGTFAESIYSLRRINNIETFSRIDLLKSLFAVVLVPYFRNKLKTTAENIYFGSYKERWQKYIAHSITTLEIGLQLADFLMLYRYLTNQSASHSIWLKIFNLKLVYDQDQSNINRNWLPFLFQKVFEIGAFFLQFYQWWLSEHRGVFRKLPVPDSPESKGEIFQQNCPLCRKAWSIETALSVSGYVFCFNCIKSHLEKEKNCPVTKIPASFKDLVRIY